MVDGGIGSGFALKPLDINWIFGDFLPLFEDGKGAGGIRPLYRTKEVLI
jgi:hypothetical protein